ncbi:MAG: nitroreductase family protein [Synergistaceae bacterium]|nr:nitroreductase family protein [Synergistaceae bacterium]
MTKINNIAIDNILTRRSIRRFNVLVPVKQSDIECLIECASAAPSARNSRPCHFIAVTKRELLDTLSKTLPHGKMLIEATLAVVVCGETERDGNKLDYWEQDCAAAMENLLLAANALGLGAVWLGVRHSLDNLEMKLKLMFKIPENIAILGIAAIGHPAETKDPHKGIIPTSFHLNKW